MTLTELSIKRPSLIVVLFAALGVLGIFCFSRLKYELLPKITPPFITVATVYPGASPTEVETSVTRLLEDAVSGVDKIKTVSGTSAEGISIVAIEFAMSADVNIALQDAQRKVLEVASQLPEDARTPTVSKFAIDEMPVLRMGVTGTMPSREFYQLVKDKVQPLLAKIPGVGQITLIGGDEREIKVNIDPRRLQSYGLSLMQATQAIKSANLDFPTGKVEDGDEQYIVRIAGKFTSVDDLRRSVVAHSKEGGDITISDIAEVEDGRREYSQVSRIDGLSSIGILVSKQSDANTVDVSTLVRKEIPVIEALYRSSGLTFDIAQDGSTFTLDAANAVKKDLTLAVVLVAIVMLAFLHSIRNSIIVMIAIPASLMSTFIVMYAFDLTLNLMTLLGLSLVVGILVDDSIVVLENIYHFLEKGEKPADAALKGRNEIGFAALSITLVDVVVFLPLALVSGLVGNIMREFAMTVVFSTLMSLFVSFTVTPLLASRFAKLEKLTTGSLLGRFGLWFEGRFERLTGSYVKVLEWGLAHRGKVVGITIALFLGSFALVPLGFIGSEFIAVADRGEFAVTLELSAGSTLENTNAVTQEAERMISTIPEVRKMFVNVGASSDGFLSQSSSNIAELNIALVPKRERLKSTDDVAEEIKQMLSGIPGAKVRANPIGIFGTANQTPIQIVVSGTSYADARNASSAIADAIKTIPGTADVRLSSEEGKPETRIEIDRQKMASFGLTVAEVGQTLRVAFNGDDDSKFREGDNEYRIRIVLDEFNRSSTSDIGSVIFVNRKGQMVELKQFATIYQATGPTKLQRQDRNPSVTVFSQAVGRPSGSIGEDIQKAVAGLTLPEGITIAYKGDLQNQSEGFDSLALALGAAILFMYMIMVALYDSYVYPFVVMFSVPVALIGALLALALTMKSLSIFSILGVIMLVGLVGKNAILLVDRANQTRAYRGLTPHDALVEASRARLRPILMTTVAMVFGMLPIAFSTESGAEWKSGLAWAIVGGLTSSLLLTLVLVPIVYLWVDGVRVRFPAFFVRAGTSIRSRFRKRGVQVSALQPE